MLSQRRKSTRVLCLALIACAACKHGSVGSGPSPSTVAVTVDPSAATIVTGGTLLLTADVTGTDDERVSWSVVGAGSIDATGLYTAPTTPGVYQVIAVSVASPAHSGVATITVVAPTPVVSVSPQSATVATGGTVVFTAAVENAAVTDVTWSVTGGDANGTIAADGTYTAPASAGTYEVVATSVADASASGSASVTVFTPPPPTGPVTVSVSPATAALTTGGSVQLTASVSGSANTGVTWSVTGGSANGTVSATGRYTAPSTPGTYTVVATSVADGTATGSAIITVTSPVVVVAVSLTPRAATVATGGTVTFTAKVTGSSNTSVTWTVTGGDANGTISSGVYTAPGTAGTYEVVATSVADPTKKATAAVTVTVTTPGTGPVVRPFVATGLTDGWANGETRVLVDNGGTDLFGFGWDGSSLALYRSGDLGASWPIVARTGAAFGDPTISGQGAVMAIAQTSDGKVHVLSDSVYAYGLRYWRVALTRTGSTITGYQVEAGPFSLPATAANLRVGMLAGYDGSGNERLIIAVADDSGSNFRLRVWRAPTAPASAAAFVNFADGGSTISDVFNGALPGAASGASTSHWNGVSIAQVKNTRDVYLVYGGVNAGDNGGPNGVGQLSWIRCAASGANWSIGSPQPFGTRGNSPPLVALGMSGADNAAYLLWNDSDGTGGIRLSRLDATGITHDVAPRPLTGDHWTSGGIQARADGGRFWIFWQTTTDPYGGSWSCKVAYWDGSSWSITDMGNSTRDIWGTFASSGLANGVVFGWISWSDNTVELGAIYGP